MKKFSKILFFLTLFSFIIWVAIADRGGFGRKRNKIQLNITALTTLRNSISLNLRSGVSFKGSQILNRKQIGNFVINTDIISYKKGNSIYVLPYKQKIVIPSFSQTSGYKLIIRRK
ncbi:MAG: hypothetical protein H0V14_09635 [Chitinophagaceae bacterium]|nr:hypothetical protein [Chitinophagaceae bacterium]